ncbi:MAG: hypothetical protein Q8R31_04770 [Candidatus Omnitrophota bacterium]|nr:hypothetical protein [Candidatus Omnitrophota bacterium]
MAQLERGQKLACVPCGREVVISNLGISEATVWCCGKPMKGKARVKIKKKINK